MGWFSRGKKPERPAAAAPPAAAGGSAQPAPAASGRMPLAGAAVTVFGLGASGLAAARLLAREGARVTVTDEGDNERLRAALEGLPEGIEARLGDPAAALAGARLVVLSPGVPRRHPLLAEAEVAGAQVIGEVELAFRHLSAPLIGITGTNGKSTVTALTGHILEGHLGRVFTGGNLGRPLSEAALDPAPWDMVVAELSSFQLEGIVTLRPRLAALLNTSPDHMDRYDTVADYYKAKFRIFENMADGYALLNAADESTPLVSGHYLKGARPVLFNLPGDGTDGVRMTDGVITITTGGATHPILPVERLRITGAQNVENAQAAAALCLLAGCPLPVVAERLASFEGLPHRMQVVGNARGITWINDSKATNPGAVAKALAGQAAPVTLLLGGRDKGGDLFSLREHVFQHAGRVVVFGEAAEKFRIVLQGHPDMTVCDTLKDAVHVAAGAAREGEVVLLSPACASFDEFDNFMHRGDCFRQYVEALP